MDKYDCKACIALVELHNLPVCCVVHALDGTDNGIAKTFSQIIDALATTERLHDDNEMRQRILGQQLDRIRSWKQGVQRA